MNYIDFKKKLLADNEFAAKFADCKTVEALIEAAAKDGYTFTAEDMENAEILPEEIEKVAGGFFARNE